MIDHGQVRRSDPATSREAARLIRPGSARHALLAAHNGHRDGLTDEEAALIARLSLTSEYATRCSELMRAGLLVDTPMARVGSSGMSRLVRRITLFGRSMFDSPVAAEMPPVSVASRAPISPLRSGQHDKGGETTTRVEDPGAAPTRAVFGDYAAIRKYVRPGRRR